MPREADTTRAGDESKEETERRRLDWPTASVVVVVVVVKADRCCLLLGRAEAETAIAARGVQERTGALTRGQEAREAMAVFLVEFDGREIEKEDKRNAREMKMKELENHLDKKKASNTLKTFSPCVRRPDPPPEPRVRAVHVHRP